MATAWDLYDSFNAPEALLSAKPSSVAGSKGNLLAKDQDENLDGKYKGRGEVLPSVAGFAGCLYAALYLLLLQVPSFPVHRTWKVQLFSGILQVLSVSWIPSMKLRFCFFHFVFVLDAWQEFVAVSDRGL